MSLLVAFIFTFCITAYAREPITDINLEITHTQNEITINDIHIQANTPHYVCERKEFQPVTKHVTLYLRADNGFVFQTKNASQVVLNGAKYVTAKKMENSSLLILTVELTGNVIWLENRGGWENSENAIKYKYEDGHYASEGWNQIGDKHYYFDANGNLLINTQTPDGYKVGVDGAWIEEDKNEKKVNKIANVKFSQDSITQDLAISDYIYNTGSYFLYHIYEITNNSQSTIEVNINETAMDGQGNAVGAKSLSERDIPSGHTVFIYTTYDSLSVSGFDATFQVKDEKYYQPVAQNISLNTVKSGDKIIVTATNNGNIPIEFPEIVGVFFNGDKVIRVDSTFVTDGDYELKPGASITKELSTYNEFFTDYVIHVTGRASK